MPLTLAARIGPDSLGTLERAAAQRFADARSLAGSGRGLGATYLYGYCVEMRLKTAYYRFIGLVPSSLIDPFRKPAEARIRALLGLPPHVPIGHYIVGWARLLEDTRASVPGRALPAPFATTMTTHATDLFLCWREILRYRANRPYNDELMSVASVALLRCRTAQFL